MHEIRRLAWGVTDGPTMHFEIALKLQNYSLRMVYKPGPEIYIRVSLM